MDCRMGKVQYYEPFLILLCIFGTLPELLNLFFFVNWKTIINYTRIAFYVSGFGNSSVAICQLTALS